MPFHDSLINTRRAVFYVGLVLATMVFGSMTPAAIAVQPTTRVFVPPSKNEVLIRQYLYEADDALARDRLTSPKNDNAYAGYRRVLALDPRNERALAGIKRISRRYLSMAKKAEQDSDFERAIGYAQQAQRMAPGYEGTAHMVKHLQQRKAVYDAQQMQMVKGGAGAVKVTLKSKGNEYFVAASDISRRNVTAKAQLAEIAQKAKEMDSRILILAKNDGDGRWMYAQMRESITDEYRLRGNIRVDSQTKIVLLDQPLASPAPAVKTPAAQPQVNASTPIP